MIITGVDYKHEDLLLWWYETVQKYNPEIKIGIWDLGMTPKMRITSMVIKTYTTSRTCMVS